MAHLSPKRASYGSLGTLGLTETPRAGGRVVGGRGAPDNNGVLVETSRRQCGLRPETPRRECGESAARVRRRVGVRVDQLRFVVYRFGV